MHEFIFKLFKIFKKINLIKIFYNLNNYYFYNKKFKLKSVLITDFLIFNFAKLKSLKYNLFDFRFIK